MPNNEDENAILIASRSIAEKFKDDAEIQGIMTVCQWLEDGVCFVVPEKAWDEMLERAEVWGMKERTEEAEEAL